MTATIAPVLPMTTTVEVPRMTREQRREELADLLADIDGLFPPSPLRVRVLVAACASDLLSAGQVQEKWKALRAEWGRLAAYEAGEPEWRDLEPGLARADCEAALNDLVDATTTHTGDRTS